MRIGLLPLALVGIPIFIAGVVVSVSHAEDKIQQSLRDRGFTDVRTSAAFFSRQPFDMVCSSKGSHKVNFTAQHNGKHVSGFACYEPFLGFKHWLD